MTSASSIFAPAVAPRGERLATKSAGRPRKPWRLALFVALWLAAGLAVVAAVAAMQPGRGIAVIYPDIGEPYRSVFAKIIEGVEDKAKGRVPTFAVGAGANLQDIASELRRQDVRVVIALGRNGLKAASALERDIAIVAGGVVSIPEAEAGNMAVFSLAPDPALLFARLQGFVPGVKRVFVVYDPRQNAWLMRLAREAAATGGIELVAREAPDLKSALRIYQEILAGSDAKRDALWLLQDTTTVDETTVLPLVLQEAWGRNLVLFSSNMMHVRRGALFSLYPNNLEVGRSLASSALGYAAASGQQPPRGVTTMKAVSTAVNLRTASHLGLNLPGRQSFDMVFPEP